MPDFTFENRYRGSVAGIDEAGRGPLAGPVVASAVILPRKDLPIPLDDSKALSPKARERMLNVLRSTAIIGVGIAEPEEIDRLNVLHASLTAMKRALSDLGVIPDAALIDGNKVPPDMPCPAEAIVKGDSKSFSIAAASIVAKVTRDRLMLRAHSVYPQYGFDHHMGYPTKAHKAALEEHGPCPLHRLSYRPCREVYVSHFGRPPPFSLS